MGRAEGELDLAVDDHMKADAGIALVEKDLAAGRVDFPCSEREAIDLLRVQLAEERQVGEEGLELDLGVSHGGVEVFVAR